MIFVVSMILLTTSNKLTSSGVVDFNTKLFGKFKWLTESVVLLNSLIILSVMLACVSAISRDSLPPIFDSLKLAPMLIGIIGIFVVKNGIDSIKKSNVIIVPIIILILCIVTSISISKIDISFNFKLSTIPKSLVYIAFNMFLVANAIFKLSLTKKQTVATCCIVSIVLSVLIMLLIFAINSDSSSMSAALPLLYLARKLGWGFYWIIILTLVAGVFTSVLLAIYNIVEWLSTFIRDRVIAGLLAVILAFCISMFGFQHIVAIFYPIIGVFGVLYTICCLRFVYKN
jgi:uncharacterized membrane protein YkvI